LQNRLGGEYIPHARDTVYLDPSKYEGKKVKGELGLKEEKIIIFLGSPKPHKGIEDLFYALKYLKRKDVKLLIIGAANEYPSKDQLAEDIAPFVIITGMIPFTRIPEYLAVSDIVVIPQRNVPFSMGQVPAKLFDAMAMAKPIISTKISDMPEILKDCGIIAEPNNPEHLAEKIDFILTNPDKAKEIGREARARCIQRYSLKVVGAKLINYIQDVIK